MTSDAKIGLLLGLVFIFAIAFIINGLPRLQRKPGNIETVDSLQNYPPGLGAKERKVRYEVISPVETVKESVPAVVKTPPPTAEKQDVRFETQLPQGPSIVRETVEAKAPIPIQPLPAEEKKEKRKVEMSTANLARVYVVKEGDCLATIAKEFYGAEDGNKRINVARIFEANRQILKSPDEIYPGQKIIIPPLTSYSQDKNKIQSVFSTTMFKKVPSIGQRHVLNERPEKKQTKWYIVRENDNLWQIATEQLGSGSRYAEIAKLNANILEDEDNLPVGIRLKLPVQ